MCCVEQGHKAGHALVPVTLVFTPHAAYASFVVLNQLCWLSVALQLCSNNSAQTGFQAAQILAGGFFSFFTYFATYTLPIACQCPNRRLGVRYPHLLCLGKE